MNQLWTVKSSPEPQQTKLLQLLLPLFQHVHTQLAGNWTKALIGHHSLIACTLHAQQCAYARRCIPTFFLTSYINFFLRHFRLYSRHFDPFLEVHFEKKNLPLPIFFSWVTPRFTMNERWPSFRCVGREPPQRRWYIQRTSLRTCITPRCINGLTPGGFSRL